jgi:hypothetical protein
VAARHVKLYFCTYFDSNYLARALVLYRSLVDVGAEFTLWALCLDDDAYRLVSELRLAGFEPVSLAELEQADREAAATKGTRSRVEYYFTLTPALTRYLLDSHPEVDVISYLDADLRFYAHPQPIFDAMNAGSVLIIPHDFPECLVHLEHYGRYNVGLVAFRRDAAGLACLDRWRRRCIEWCFDRVEDGKFADQAYLDDWPQVHEGVVVMERPGVGMGPWNFSRYRIDVGVTPPTVDEEPLVFYHFHAFRSLGGPLFDDGLASYGVMDRAVRAYLYGGYVRELAAAGARLGRLQRVGDSSGRGVRWARVREFVRLARGRHLLVRVGDRVLG